MSKYIDLILALNKLWKLCAEDIDAEISDSEVFDFSRARDALSDLPTIEVREDAVSRDYLEKQYWQTLIPREMVNTDAELGINIGIDKMQDVIKNAPSVIPKPKEGEWIKQFNGTKCVCSICGYSNGRKHNDNFCPNCGAKMKGTE